MSGMTKIRIIDNRSDKEESMYCSVCSYPILTGDDFASSQQYDCCHGCFLTFIEATRKTWVKGTQLKQNLVDSYTKTKDELSHKTRSIK